MTKGRAVLAMKDKELGAAAAMRKLFPGILADKIYDHLEERHLLPEEQKGCGRKSGGTKD